MELMLLEAIVLLSKFCCILRNFCCGWPTCCKITLCTINNVMHYTTVCNRSSNSTTTTQELTKTVRESFALQWFY